MHLIVLDEECIELHRKAYSDVTWEIVEHLSRGDNVVIDGQDSRRALDVEWACDYFGELIKMRDHANADILVAPPNQLQAYIDAEQRFLSLKGYKIIDGIVHADTTRGREARKKQVDALKNIRELCSRIFSYGRFLSGKSLKCVKLTQYGEGSNFFVNLGQAIAYIVILGKSFGIQYRGKKAARIVSLNCTLRMTTILRKVSTPISEYQYII